jgi:hypothetical protein
MKKYSGYLIIGENTKVIEVIADTVQPDSTCTTRFHRQISTIGLYGTPEKGFQLVAQYPTDKLVITSVEDLEEAP